MPYSIAVALVTGKAGIAEFVSPYIDDSFIIALNKMVCIQGDEDLSKLVPDKRVAVLHVTQKDGKEFTCREEYPKGEPENPLTEEELFMKFSTMAVYGGKSLEWAKRIFNYIITSDSLVIEKIN